MGLDMYLNRMPRYKNVTPTQVCAIEGLFDLELAKERKSEYANCSLKEWCGISEDELPDTETIEHFRPLFKTHYYYWDIERKYGNNQIMEQVGYWRKANQIHNWFVENIQDGVDDCEYHREVTKEDLENLLDTCRKVYDSCELVDGTVVNGKSFKDGQLVNNYETGKVVEDPYIAQKLLPRQQGFFFGGDGYDEYYVEDIEATIDIISEVLETTDFETQMVCYISSW